MKRNLLKQLFSTRMGTGAAGLILIFSAFVPSPVSAADATPVVQPLSLESAARRATDEVANRASYRAWKRSVVPVFASQALDVASSYGMRELNPMLAGTDGRFGAKGAGIKLGATAGLVGVEYLIVRKFPRTARIFSKINWTVSIATTGLAVHNFAIR